MGRQSIPRDYRVNRSIRVREVRLVDEKGNQVGIVSLGDALNMSEERGLDLVEVAPNSAPPVCRILDYGKFRYVQTKKNVSQVRFKKATSYVKSVSEQIANWIMQAAGNVEVASAQFLGGIIKNPWAKGDDAPDVTSSNDATTVILTTTQSIQSIVDGIKFGKVTRIDERKRTITVVPGQLNKPGS